MSRGDGDGWVTLPDGSERWGIYGAAGVLLNTPGSDGETPHVLLQHRAAWTHQGDTWGMPGGALDSGESSVDGALREFGEEVAGDLGPIDVSAVHRAARGTWHYDTVLARSRTMRPFANKNAESREIRWVPVDRVGELPLLPAFGEIWPLLRGALSARLDLVVDADAVLARSGGSGEEAVAELRDALAGLAGAGVPGDVLPDHLALPPLHLWFPRVHLVTDADVEPAPGVTIARGTASADAAGAARSPGGRAVLAVTDRAGRAGTAPPEWLLEKAGLEPLVHCA
ncbi:NUDIX hydrolase [Nocardiopsis composta]|uniref:8-oxo-dGTP pyrophosphatase MutT (NUDIX family) n=1 Tax=Nocardiopsis composta TaxID=157465 RepID=A0A7W8QPU2_9ACTN|nr:NUDIX hydrolase [Nocardiopsis composta]MBB5433683.1 8-oxo-dGTP pyrophosphatase MutT (NUDIX family) [Nocardiopsis composta]